MYAHTHTHTQTRTHLSLSNTHTYSKKSTNTHIHTHIHAHTHAHTHMHTHMHTHTLTRTSVSSPPCVHDTETVKFEHKSVQIFDSGFTVQFRRKKNGVQLHSLPLGPRSSNLPSIFFFRGAVRALFFGFVNVVLVRMSYMRMYIHLIPERCEY